MSVSTCRAILLGGLCAFAIGMVVAFTLCLFVRRDEFAWTGYILAVCVFVIGAMYKSLEPPTGKD